MNGTEKDGRSESRALRGSNRKRQVAFPRISQPGFPPEGPRFQFISNNSKRFTPMLQILRYINRISLIARAVIDFKVKRWPCKQCTLGSFQSDRERERESEKKKKSDHHPRSGPNLCHFICFNRLEWIDLYPGLSPREEPLTQNTLVLQSSLVKVGEGLP